MKFASIWSVCGMISASGMIAERFAVFRRERLHVLEQRGERRRGQRAADQGAGDRLPPPMKSLQYVPPENSADPLLNVGGRSRSGGRC